MKEEKLKIKNSFYFSIIGVAIFIFLIVIGSYFFNFKEFGLSTNNASWGAFGDFIGGTLNPIFALLSFIALLVTIKIQSDELGLTRIELEKSSQALTEQSKSLIQQNFENTFFKMIDLHNEIVNQLILTQILPNRVALNGKRMTQNYKIMGATTEIRDDKDYVSKKTIKKLLEIFNNYCSTNNNKDINILYDKFHNEYQEIVGHYFGHIYQVLKFIDESSIKDKKRYSSLYRAQFSVSEIELLAYHCISKVAIKKFKPLIEEYKFLEHLKDKKTIERIKDLYKPEAFGDNSVYATVCNIS